MRQIQVTISKATDAALRQVMEREEVTLPEALRRLVGYGDLVYTTTRVEGGEVLTRHGRRQEVVRLVDQEPEKGRLRTLYAWLAFGRPEKRA